MLALTDLLVVEALVVAFAAAPAVVVVRISVDAEVTLAESEALGDPVAFADAEPFLEDVEPFFFVVAEVEVLLGPAAADVFLPPEALVVVATVEV